MVNRNEYLEAYKKLPFNYLSYSNKFKSWLESVEKLGFKFLSFDDLTYAILKEIPMVGIGVDKENQKLIIIKCDLTCVEAPFSWFGKQNGSSSPDPDFDDAEIIDFGHTIRLGKYECGPPMEIFKARLAEKLAEKKNGRIAADPPPRYDDVFFEGVTALNNDFESLPIEEKMKFPHQEPDYFKHLFNRDGNRISMEHHEWFMKGRWGNIVRQMLQEIENGDIEAARRSHNELWRSVLRCISAGAHHYCSDDDLIPEHDKVRYPEMIYATWAILMEAPLGSAQKILQTAKENGPE